MGVSKHVCRDDKLRQKFSCQALAWVDIMTTISHRTHFSQRVPWCKALHFLVLLDLKTDDTLSSRTASYIICESPYVRRTAAEFVAQERHQKKVLSPLRSPQEQPANDNPCRESLRSLVRNDLHRSGKGKRDEVKKWERSTEG